MRMIPKKLNFFLFNIAIIFFILGAESYANNDSFPTTENGTCYKRVRYDDEVAANISRGIVKIMPGSQQVGVKTGGNNQGWVTIVDCCEGYARNSATGQCETHCTEGCFGGTCTGPNVCTCDEGWRPEAGVCKPVCRRACSSNAHCFAPDVCTCKFGYEEISGICRPVCLHDCKNGDCVAPRNCRCHPGYALNATKHCEPVCEGGCPHGKCTSPGICSCGYGYVNPPHDLEYCVPECPESCKNGECYRPGVCTCNPGYIQDTDGSCIPRCQDGCPNGVCVAPEQCNCNPGFLLNPKIGECVESRGVGIGSSNLDARVYESATTESYRSQVYSEVSRSTDKPPTQNLYATARGKQEIIQNRNQPQREQGNTYEPKDQYEMYGPGQTQSPQGNRSIKTREQAKNTQMTVSPDGEVYSNQYGTATRPSQTQYRTSTRPSQNQGSHDVNTFYYIAEDDRTRQTQRPAASQGTYMTENSYKPYGRNQIVGSSTTDNYDDYRYYKTQRPPQHTSHSTQNPNNLNEWNQTQEFTTTDNYYDHYGNDQTQRNQNRGPSASQGSFPPQGPYHLQESNNSKRLNNTDNSDYYRTSQTRGPPTAQGPFPKQTDPYELHRRNQTQELSTTENYDYYRNNQTPRPSNQQGPFPPQGTHAAQGPSSTQRQYDSNNPYGYHKPSQTQSPVEFSTHGVNQAQPHGIPSASDTYRPQNPAASQEPYSFQDVRASSNPYETQGVKTAHRRPNTDQTYGRPATLPSNTYPGVNQPYDINEMHSVPEYNRPIENPGSNQFYGIYLTYDPAYIGNDGTITVLNPTPSFIDPSKMTQPLSQGICSFPCINGQCVGPNQCACNRGYTPDPRSLIGNVCLPVCLNGCINGVCSGPNLCICNPGFVKEQGAKGSHRCVQAY